MNTNKYRLLLIQSQNKQQSLTDILDNIQNEDEAILLYRSFIKNETLQIIENEIIKHIPEVHVIKTDSAIGFAIPNESAIPYYEFVVDILKDNKCLYKFSFSELNDSDHVSRLDFVHDSNGTRRMVFVHDLLELNKPAYKEVLDKLEELNKTEEAQSE